MKLAVLCMGNPILTDDGVGIHIAAELKKVINRPEVSVIEAGIGGIRLLDLLASFDAAIIVDAIQTKKEKTGHIFRFDNNNLQETKHSYSSHDIDLQTALNLGTILGISLPSIIVIYAIEAENVSEFSEACTPDVNQAIPTCVSLIQQEIKKILKL